MSNTFDFAPLWRSTVGFDHLAELVDSTLRPVRIGQPQM
jgi:molecular chaperone IbpA